MGQAKLTHFHALTNLAFGTWLLSFLFQDKGYIYIIVIIIQQIQITTILTTFDLKRK